MGCCPRTPLYSTFDPDSNLRRIKEKIQNKLDLAEQNKIIDLSVEQSFISQDSLIDGLSDLNTSPPSEYADESQDAASSG